MHSAVCVQDYIIIVTCQYLKGGSINPPCVCPWNFLFTGNSVCTCCLVCVMVYTCVCHFVYLLACVCHIVLVGFCVLVGLCILIGFCVMVCTCWVCYGVSWCHCVGGVINVCYYYNS